MKLDVCHIRSEFPILSKKINNNRFIYLDNAASTQKPSCVIEAEKHFYEYEYSAIHRSTHITSIIATDIIENVRNQVANFINASSSEEVIFVRGTTEGINLIANTWGLNNISYGDNIILTEMEHHSNIVPWQILAERNRVNIRFIPLTKDGSLDLDKLDDIIDTNTKLVAITHISNVLGVINPIKYIISKARSLGIITLIDGAQAISNQIVDVQDIGCDFYVFSGHKIYSSTGIGILYGRKELLNKMPPWEGGGSMIKEVSLTDKFTCNDIPWKFEAGSPNSVGIISLGAAIKYINNLGIKNIIHYKKNITSYLLNKLSFIPEIIIYGKSDNHISIVSFNLNSHHAYDVGCLLDNYGIAIRTGHHCAMPTMNYFGVSSMCRVSLAIYNNKEEIDFLVDKLLKINNMLNK